MRVLLTAAGSPGAWGTVQCMKKGTKVVGADTTGISPVLGRCIKVPWPEEDGYLDAIRSVCKEEKIDVILPGATRELAKLAEGVGVPVAVSSREAILRAIDKWTLMERYPGRSPKHYLVHSPSELEEAAKRLGYSDEPIAVKPRVSDGMRGFRVLKQSEKTTVERFLSEKPVPACTTLEMFCESFTDGFPELMACEYLPGLEYSVDCFGGRNRLWAVPRVREKIVNGICFQSKTTREIRNKLAECSNTMGADMGLRYAFGFQFKEDRGGVPKLLECNPRIQGTMYASALAGANVIWWAVEEALGIYGHEEPKMRDLTFCRWWGGSGWAT